MNDDETSSKTFDEALRAAFEAGVETGLYPEKTGSMDRAFTEWRRGWAGDATSNIPGTDHTRFIDRLPRSEQPHSGESHCISYSTLQR